eukprot:37640-Eustigmatos_ZCMA.PRE.1
MHIETRSAWTVAPACAGDRLFVSPGSHHGNAAKVVAFLTTAASKHTRLEGSILRSTLLRLIGRCCHMRSKAGGVGWATERA